MKQWITLSLLTAALSGFAQFDEFFLDRTLRMDYYHSGNDKEEFYTFDELLEEPFWAGSKTNLIDTFEYGNYFVKVVNIANDSLLYSRGYGSLFGEWQTTEEAKETWRTLSECVTFPFPKVQVRVELYSRNWDGIFEKKFEYTVSPDNYFIKQDRRKAYPAFDVYISGNPENKVDIVVLPEGYSPGEMGLFVEDCKKFVADFFAFAPYSENTDRFNIRGVLAPSEESGVDIPADTVWKNTILNSAYYTFDSERYLMTFDNKSVRDLAANAPYDQIYILVNSKKYGGGAIYNYYNVSVNSNAKSAKILTHEFGHGFAGLADEYYNNSTSYGGFYNLKIEPWEPNITTLVNFADKWKNLVKKRTPVPTPQTEKYSKRIGAFEGGGYEPKGMFRPMQDCLMKTFYQDKFCPPCSVAIQQMIDFYSE
ncbi:MAG: IgA Peptidase M64 [Bacteroidales bacterium]|nr:IgA Peptidase M64 [Bacteroidales bacterium]MCF6342056.1 IgA Peptidase M64 [Bacteroidales bacterium]